jgi:hypothetical protein
MMMLLHQTMALHPLHMMQEIQLRLAAVQVPFLQQHTVIV